MLDVKIKDNMPNTVKNELLVLVIYMSLIIGFAYICNTMDMLILFDLVFAMIGGMAYANWMRDKLLPLFKKE